jgi:hypothetical protein
MEMTIAVAASFLGAALLSGTPAYAASSTALSVPTPPQSPSAEIYSDSEQHVMWSPPTADGGAQITSYTVDWDTDPGVPEVQTISSTTQIGPNEVQTVTTAD